VVRFMTLQQQIDDAFGRERLFAMMTNLFGAIALLLSAIGLYGLLSSSVTQRTGEMGVRLALGAPRKSVQWMILKEAFILLAAGVVLGGILLYTTARFIQGMLYHISAFDPVTLMIVIALLAVVALGRGVRAGLSRIARRSDGGFEIRVTEGILRQRISDPSTDGSS
jgi:ABC-type antimicrobial peptide transport system permease subunit